MTRIVLCSRRTISTEVFCWRELHSMSGNLVVNFERAMPGGEAFEPAPWCALQGAVHPRPWSRSSAPDVTGLRPRRRIGKPACSLGLGVRVVRASSFAPALSSARSHTRLLDARAASPRELLCYS